MAPKKKPYSQLKSSAKNYRNNEASRKHKNSEQRKRNKTQANKDYRSELNRVRRADGNYGKGGDDYSHTKSGRIVRENPSKNRARNRGRK
jgi:hypothetical protein|tara:strand:- start:864 stop:1133 length:270 start_codon:yes stop_codon:yes gene_type:complete